MAHRQIADSFDSGRDLMRDFLGYELRTRFLAEYMTKVDGGAMYYSIEARSPFLDQRMWEHAASLPIEMRLRGNELKAILRALVRRNVGPQVASRKKQGFTVPVENWLANGWRPQLDALVEDPLLEQQGWMRKGELAGAVARAIEQGRAPVQLWTLVVLENWLRASRVRAPDLLHS